ncbi:Elongation factor P [bacterium HR35]|nr:Elongation factor P [bacterium HR35]
MKVSDLAKGDHLKLEGKIFEVVEIKHSHLGRGSANLTLVLRNVQTNQRIEKTFKPDEQIDYLEVEKEKLVYSHRDSQNFYFKRDSQLISLPTKLFENLSKFLKPNLEVLGYFSEDEELLWVELPKIVEYLVVETGPDFKGSTVQSSYKPAKIETGLEIKVPFFIKNGDLIKVNTETGEYVERVQK